MARGDRDILQCGSFAEGCFHEYGGLFGVRLEVFKSFVFYADGKETGEIYLD